MSARTPSPITISNIPKLRLREAAHLSRRAFGFTELDTTPPALMWLHQEYGGCVLGAFADHDLVGFVPAFPCISDEKTILYSAGLCVAPDRQSGGIGTALMTALGDYAREHRYDLIKWTTSVMDSRNLYLYLNKVGATIVGYRPSIYVGLSATASDEGFDGDDVEFDWYLNRPLRAATGQTDESVLLERHALTRTKAISDHARRLVGVEEPSATDSAVIEVPWDGRALEALDKDLVTTWRRGISKVLPSILAHGGVGVEMGANTRERRAFLVFRSRNEDSVSLPPESATRRRE